MKKIITNYRYYVLFVLCVVCCLGIFAVPEDELPVITWLWVLTTTKAVGFGAGYLYAKLYNRWEANNVIPELTKFINEF